MIIKRIVRSGKIVGIDASNIRRGGGVTHLIELLDAFESSNVGISKIIVWSSIGTLKKIEDRNGIKKLGHPWLERSLLFRFFWQFLILSRTAKKENCDILFVPGGTFYGRFKPFVTMSQNLLPFEVKEFRKYGLSWLSLKFLLLRYIQGFTFRKANGVIFLTKYAQETVQKVTGQLKGQTTVIAHGIPDRFLNSSGLFKTDDMPPNNVFNILYVSIVDVYKHQWNVAKAVAILHNKGFDVRLQFVGPAYPPSLKRLNLVIDEVDSLRLFISYEGIISYEELDIRYKEADLFVFASSCENLPIILLEAMASGLPIACSKKEPMPEVLGDAGLYFEPSCPKSIADTIEAYLNSSELRKEKAEFAHKKALDYSWKRCSSQTMDFLIEVITKYPILH
jgi:glycosyltransferase involved in cell wall biosynthesis